MKIEVRAVKYLLNNKDVHVRNLQSFKKSQNHRKLPKTKVFRTKLQHRLNDPGKNQHS